MILGLLSQGDAHGYELKRRHDDLFAGSASAVNVGQIYVTLSRLERDGLVEHRTEASDEGGPDRKVHSLTPVGSDELTSWLESPAPVPQLRSAALLKIVVALELGHAELRPLIASHRRRCVNALRELDRQARDAVPDRSGAADLLVQATALHIQAELRWLDLLTERIETEPPVVPGETSIGVTT